MADQTVPLSGGWILVIRDLPTRIKPPPFSLFFAKPERTFPAGSFVGYTEPHVVCDRVVRDPEYDRLHRYRCGAKTGFSEDELLRCEALDAADIELEQRVRIVTAEGEVCVEPYEWVPVSDLEPYLAELGTSVHMHELGGLRKLARLREQVFYLRSRGLSILEAHRLLLGDLRQPNVVWFEIDRAVAAHFMRTPT